MTKRMKIDFVSDVACPWCVVGLGGLEAALERLKGEVEAEIRFQPFELNPDMPPGGRNKVEQLMEKYGSTREQVQANREAIRQRAAQVGFTMAQDDDSRVYSTFDAHRLLHWAGVEGRPGQQAALKHALFEAYFTRNQDTADPEVLAAAAETAGLDPAAAREVLSSGRYAAEVRALEDQWRRAGITSVPSIVVDERYLISGGQPPEAFEQALRQIASQS